MIRHIVIKASLKKVLGVKDLARHGDIRTSQKYVHNAMTDLREIVDRDNVAPLQNKEKVFIT